MLEVLYRILLSAVRELARVLDKPSPLLSRAERRKGGVYEQDGS